MVHKMAYQLVQLFEVQLLNDLVIPVVLSLQKPSLKQAALLPGLYEIYCVNNDKFFDIMLTFGSPHLIQRTISTIN